MLIFHSASTGAVNTERAVAECLENAQDGRTECDLIAFHTSMGHDFEKLVAEMRRLTNDARIIGCPGGGVIGREGPNETMRALAVMAILGSEKEYAIASMDRIAGIDPFEVGVTVAGRLKEQNPRIHTMLFFPAFRHIFPADRAIEGIKSIFGPEIQIGGGNSHAGGGVFTNFQFLDDSIIQEGAVALGIADPSLVPVMDSDHGYTVIGRPFTVTRSEKNRVYELDGKPAWTALTERAGLPNDADPFSSDALPLCAHAVPWPEEIAALAESDHRVVFGGPLGTDDGSLILGVTVEEGSPLWMTHRDEDVIFAGVDRMARSVADRGGGRSPEAVFHSDCLMRGRFSFNRILKDELIDRLQFPICGEDIVPWLGFYSGGEFSKIGTRNVCGFYTSTICGLYRRGDETHADTDSA